MPNKSGSKKFGLGSLGIFSTFSLAWQLVFEQVIPYELKSSGVTRVGVTRCGNWWHYPIFFP